MFRFTIMVLHLADAWNSCTDVFRQMCRTDVQMMLINISHCKWQYIQGQGPGPDQ